MLRNCEVLLLSASVTLQTNVLTNSQIDCLKIRVMLPLSSPHMNIRAVSYNRSQALQRLM